MESIEFKEIKIKPLGRGDFLGLLEMEKEIYPKELVQGGAMLQDIEKGNGLEYSVVSFCGKERVGYLIAVESENKKGEQAIYLEDVAVLPKAQRQGIAWKMVRELVKKLRSKAEKQNSPVLLEMHLRETSQNFFKKYQKELKAMGVEFAEEIFLPGYYRNGEGALYRVYQVNS